MAEINLGISTRKIPSSASKELHRAEGILKALWGECTGFARGHNPFEPSPEQDFKVFICNQLDRVHSILCKEHILDAEIFSQKQLQLSFKGENA